MNTKSKVVLTLIGIVAVGILVVFVFLFPEYLNQILFVGIVIAGLIAVGWFVKQIGCSTIGAILLGVGALIVVIYLLTKLPLPDPARPQAELEPCEQALLRVGASGEIDCRYATKGDITKTIKEHVPEFNRPDGSLTDWGDRLAEALLDSWPAYDFGHFSNILIQYEKEKADFQTNKFRLTQQEQGNLIGMICIIPIAGGLLTLVLSLMGLGGTFLRVLSKIIIPLLAGIGILAGIKGYYFPLLGAYPTITSNFSSVTELFWLGFKIMIAASLISGILSMIIGAMSGMGGLASSLLYTVLQGASTAIGWGLIQNTISATAIFNAVAINPNLTASMALNATILGMIFGITVIPLPQFFLSLIFRD